MTAQLAIPAIDLKGGRCVRLYQGDPDRETVYGDDPVAMARHWERLGARWLHLVDLDGAFTGNSANRNVIAAIGRAVTIPFQVGGGIRSREDLERMLEAGASRVILGTVMVKQPQLAEKLAVEFGDKLIAGIDAREGLVTVQGWTEQGEIRAVELARRVEQWGVGQIIYTDTEKDGTLSGPNYKGLEQILAASSLKVIVAGGISSLKDLQALKSYAPRVTGVIIGQALYTNRFTLPEAIAALA
ncbi:MAG TPA: 1-(5-phosphoribosyl)-5-[(5-phosphoribosylamino)methylideneamino]imidazole-4-carboxamide isomerase [Bacillota bacterium]|jgi:phosphoribosylformimino-5-aminoimidazole carboxamide ribotide isomerase|nr:1-(5-phosphoribosyl)-5-[(5-phosphoribosylamino)methylideneamino]imidazole-4-carboxamide isomerase [Bacillota bacterium]HPZ40754.1 1-(5-phosphoribosyl)-5-[(5-phosphoribosylamino)methylideneamino]imidazole-4-carboxamide isomerase [Bacillota bacterium]HQD51713.1 1-(5-phosphoribosyl)-5-[(5-phosphoribosylamino)methylideneamino]imidazole-4-carboxamide isomerase [Bacillota bacterium]